MKLKQIISFRRKVDCDLTASAELDCISAQELKKKTSQNYTPNVCIFVEQERFFVTRYGFTVKK